MEDLAKKLDKMTVKELREMAKELGAHGVSGMKKGELLDFIRKAKGIVVERPRKVVKKKVKKALSVKDLKARIVAIKIKRAEVLKKGDKRMATIYKRQINRLKKRARKVAGLVSESAG